MMLRELLRERIAPLKNLSDRSVVMYESTLDRFRDFLGREPTVDDLDDLTAAKFLRWRGSTVHDKKRGIISPASLAKDSAHLRTMWTWCAKKRLKRSDGELLEFPDYSRPRVPKPRPVAYTVEELQALIGAARHRKGCVGDVPAPWYWITKIRAMFETGERIGAVMQLRWGEVDLDRRTLTFLAATRKGHRETITRAISPDLAAIMTMHKRPADRLVWPWLEHRKMLSCYASLKVLCRLADVPYHPFHSIRKSTASYLKKAGKSAKTQLGHSSEEMAETHYYDSRIVGVESALDYLPPLDLGGGPGKPR
jgi:integrase